MAFLLSVNACKKNPISPATPVNNGGSTYSAKTDSVYYLVDPPVAPMIGFLSDGWKPQTFTVPASKMEK